MQRGSGVVDKGKGHGWCGQLSHLRIRQLGYVGPIVRIGNIDICKKTPMFWNFLESASDCISKSNLQSTDFLHPLTFWLTSRGTAEWQEL